MNYNKFCFNNFAHSNAKLIPVTVRHPNSTLVSKVTFKAVDVCQDIQYNKKYVSFLNMIKVKISETIIELNFD